MKRIPAIIFSTARFSSLPGLLCTVLLLGVSQVSVAQTTYSDVRGRPSSKRQAEVANPKSLQTAPPILKGEARDTIVTGQASDVDVRPFEYMIHGPNPSWSENAVVNPVSQSLSQDQIALEQAWIAWYRRTSQLLFSRCMQVGHGAGGLGNFVLFVNRSGDVQVQMRNEAVPAYAAYPPEPFYQSQLYDSLRALNGNPALAFPPNSKLQQVAMWVTVRPSAPPPNSSVEAVASLPLFYLSNVGIPGLPPPYLF